MSTSSQAFGSGLGLSIVKVEEHGASLHLEQGLNEQGCGFVVSFAPLN